jgi:phosphoribosylformylglycinamidine (FGAM) synthase PurS component
VVVKKAKHVELEIFVSLRVVDRIALTARQALTERLGYDEVLADLARQDYYRLAVAADDDEALAYAREIAENTAVFANPNKETYTVEFTRRPLSEGDRYVALAYARSGLFDESLCRHLAFDLGYDRVVAAGRGVAWTVELAPGVDPKYAEEILVASERTRGLLVNPHAEAYEIV